MFHFYFSGSGDDAAEAARRKRRARFTLSPMQIPQRLRTAKRGSIGASWAPAPGRGEFELRGQHARSIVMRARGALLMRGDEVAGDSDEVLELLRIDERVTAIRCGDQLLIRPRCAEPAGWCAVVSP